MEKAKKTTPEVLAELAYKKAIKSGAKEERVIVDGIAAYVLAEDALKNGAPNPLGKKRIRL